MFKYTFFSEAGLHRNNKIQHQSFNKFSFVYALIIIFSLFQKEAQRQFETRLKRMEEPPIKKAKRDFKSAAANSIGIGNLPREVLCIIFLYLDKKSLRNSTATCNLWFELIRGNSNLSSHVCFKIVKFHEITQDLKLTEARWPVLKSVQFSG